MVVVHKLRLITQEDITFEACEACLKIPLRAHAIPRTKVAFFLVNAFETPSLHSTRKSWELRFGSWFTAQLNNKAPNIHRFYDEQDASRCV